ncbi:hypothetical protein SSS_01758 [Sarcoptes scabiei]|uniref:Uncharacterized protein n=1 Tax=Sarcoptes scabiei TaxID=52283 RepID=A0A834VDF1_SARSC|nr:hypothetical protein SSS_01758 [Sarcoptes scabiei]
MIYSRLVNGYEKANDFDDEDYDDDNDDDDDDRNGFDPITTDEACFLTYLNAPRAVNRYRWIRSAFYQWTLCLPAGAERLFCIMMAMFLVIFVTAIHLLLYFDKWIIFYTDQTFSTTWLWYQWRSFCKPRNPDETISFDCYVWLLIGAWLGSISLATLTLAIHFLIWSLNVSDFDPKTIVSNSIKFVRK